MSAPSSVFVTFHENGSPAVVSEYRDEAEAQNGQPATEYVSLGVHEADDGAAERAAMFDDLAESAVVLTETATASRDEAMTLIRRLMSDGAEVTRLRAALSEIAALQTEEPGPVGKPDCDGYCSAGQAYFDSGYETGQFKAAEMARKGLGS